LSVPLAGLDPLLFTGPITGHCQIYYGNGLFCDETGFYSDWTIIYSGWRRFVQVESSFIWFWSSFPDEGDQGYQAPGTFQDNKGPVGDEERGIAGETCSQNVKKDINSALLANIPKEV
jgi:hypothetical protein